MLGWVIAAGPGFMLGTRKDDFVRAAEEGGLDVSACKEQRSIFNPSGGMEKCAQGVYRDVERQLNEIEEGSEPASDDESSGSGDSED